MTKEQKKLFKSNRTPYDVVYCDVDKKRIETGHPVCREYVLDFLYDFITRRYSVHLLKDVENRPKPWTFDPILQHYRFTNVRREHDKETKWLINNITSNKALQYEDKLLNCILFRLFNKHETAEILSMPIRFSKDWDPKAYRDTFEINRRVVGTYFTGAFNTGGLKRALKWYLPCDDPDETMEMRIMYFMRALVTKSATKYIELCENQKSVFRYLTSFEGIGEFLAYQIFVDFTYIPEFPFSEEEFVVAGPGCRSGINLLFEDTDGLTYEELLFWLRNNIDDLFRSYENPEWDPQKLMTDLPINKRYLNVMSLENCMCELSKYVRARLGTGRPRKRFKGV